jgi:hypothetical protein
MAIIEYRRNNRSEIMAERLCNEENERKRISVISSNGIKININEMASININININIKRKSK